MKNKFESFHRRMCQPTTFAELQAIQEELKAIGDFNDELLAAMKEELTEGRWGCLCKLIWSIPSPPSRIFTTILCDLLDNHRHIEIMEAVADAMFDLKDERAIPSLIGALDHYLIGDPDFHFNRKILYALANIGTQDAIDGIKGALRSPEKIISSTARRELERIGGP